MQFLYLLHFIVLYTAANPPKLPGVNWITKSYNMMTGTDLSQKVDGAFDIFEWTWNPERTTSGDYVYMVPEELAIPPLDPQCLVSIESKSVKTVTSYTTIDEQVRERSVGFDLKVNLGVTYEGITAGTDLEASLMFGRSTTSINAFTRAQDSFTKSFQLAASAKLYGTRMNWFGISFFDSFKNALNKVSTAPTNQMVSQFFGAYGTHVLSQVKFGSSCHETSYMKSAHDSMDYFKFNDDVKKDRLEFLFWTSSSHEHKHNQSGTTSYGLEYSFDDVQCSGEVQVSNVCQSISGKVNAPTVATYQLIPIWRIPGIPNLNEATIKAMDEFVRSVIKSGSNCRDKHCFSHGVCQPSGKIWNDIGSWDGNFSAFWEPVCFCDKGWQGSSCNQKSPSCTGSAGCPCSSNHTICPEHGLCNPQQSACMANSPVYFCGGHGEFEFCKSGGIVTSSCGSGRNEACQNSGKCPSKSSHGISCNFISLNPIPRLTGWTCEIDHGKQITCDQIGSGALVGQCQGGDSDDCKKEAYGSHCIRCDMSVSVNTKDCKWYSGGAGEFLQCPDNYVATGICGSGHYRLFRSDLCPGGAYHQLQCCSLKF